MDQPLHDMSAYRVGHATSHRMVSIGAVAAFHVVAIYLLASGLAMGLLEKLPTELKADVIPPKQEVVKPPPPTSRIWLSLAFLITSMSDSVSVPSAPACTVQVLLPPLSR